MHSRKSKSDSFVAINYTISVQNNQRHGMERIHPFSTKKSNTWNGNKSPCLYKILVDSIAAGMNESENGVLKNEKGGMR